MQLEQKPHTLSISEPRVLPAGGVSLDYSVYRDKVLAGWLGKSLGGAVGGPLENHKQWLNLGEDELWPSEFLANDDFDIQVVWLEAMQERGVFLTYDDLVEFWQDRCWYNFCEYGHFLYNVQRGIRPPLSGTWNNKFFLESEGCPIRSEIWAFVAPGNPVLAASMARMDGELDHGGLSVEIEAYLAAVASIAFLNSDLDSVLDQGLAVLPPNSRVATILEKTRSICREYPEPRQAWFLVIREFGDRDASKAITNLAIKLMALFLGGDDFKKVVHICANSGWDTDCTAATAGALWGILYGASALPQDWLEKLGKNLMCGIEVKHKNAPIQTLVDATCFLGVEMCAHRNHELRLIGAPHVEIRPAPMVAPLLKVEYPNQPVLWNSASTQVELVIENPGSATVRGKVVVSLAAGVLMEPSNPPMVEVGPYSEARMMFSFHRGMPGTLLPDKNLMKASWVSSDEVVLGAVEFGLGGARQWQVYGPYWDMYDTSRYAECPYNNADVHCHPWKVGCGSDSYQQYARLDREYLDEAKLLVSDIAEELPLKLEMGEELITQTDLGGYMGQACYYFVRTINSKDYIGSAFLIVGRTGPFRLWLDGKELGSAADVRGWSSYDADGVDLELTGKPQRLVVKVVRLTDALSFHPIILRSGNPMSFAGEKAGVSYVCDFLEDVPV